MRETLDTIRALCKVMPLTEETHVISPNLVEQNSLSIYDALIAGYTVLWSKDMQHGQVIDQQLLIQNPFR